jgi:hypothetical protein
MTASVDWDKWLGQCRSRLTPNPKRWRKFYPFCAGLLGDLMPHRLHPLMLAMGKPSFLRGSSPSATRTSTDKGTPSHERDVRAQ